ncbi:MAG: hypothetical protein IBX61_01990 [Thermoleophilia bacterium]|nr:hypothetical protein [Thermoleophilia bacterium]
MMKHPVRIHFIRNLRGMDQFEVFMVAAVATILGVRLILKITGYPQVGGATLHIAHAIWGGLLMGISILMLIIFLSKRVETLAALTGGAGFGLFIDEVGKFTTQTNDYFFQPSVAIMYVTFIALYLSVRYIFNSAGVMEIEYLVNAIREMQNIPGNRMHEHDRQQILHYLNRCDQSNPLVANLRVIAGGAYASPPRQPGMYRRWKERFFLWYRRIARARWFAPAIVVFFILQFIGSLSVMVALMFEPGEIAGQVRTFVFADWAILGSNIIAAIFIAIGVLLLKRNRLQAYTMFQRSVLVGIFVGQLFLFYKDEFRALTGLTGELLLFMALRFMIEREKDEVFEHEIEQTAESPAVAI